jgi:uncharacterized protein (DUF1778 family)
MAPRTPPPRYRIPGGRVRSVTLNIKLTSDERAMLVKLAGAKRMSLSAYVRQAAFGHAT